MESLRKQGFSHCIKIMRVSIILYIISGFLTNYLAIFTAKIMGSLADSILSGNHNIVYSNLLWLIVSIIINLVFLPSLIVVQNTVMLKESLLHDRFIYSKFLQKDYLKSRQYSPGEIVHRMEEDLVDYRFTLINLISLPFVLIFTAGCLSFYIFSCPLYGLVCVASSVAPLLVACISRKSEAKYAKETREYNDRSLTIEVELCEGFSYLKQNNLDTFIMKRFKDNFIKFYNKTGKKDINCKEVVNFFNDTSTYISQIIVIAFGAYLVSKDVISPGVIASYLGYMTSVKFVADSCASLLRLYSRHKINGDRLVEFYKDEEINSSKEISSIQNISIENLGLCYDNNPPTFENINIMVLPKAKLCIQGGNGRGKSSLIKILCGLYRNYTGSIKFNDLDVKTLDIHSLRQHIAYVEQDPYIFKGTMEDNLKIANPSKTAEELIEVLEKVQLKKKLSDEIYMNGENLSGGEKQKLSLARGILKDCNLIILDEPTNHLDRSAIEIVKHLISNMNATVIFVSHDKDLEDLATTTLNL